MPNTYKMTVDLSPRPEEMKIVRQGLVAYNYSHTQDDRYQPLAIFVRDAEDAVVGGLLGDMYWGWLAINILWLDEPLRGQGWGTQLLKTAESIAIEHGCHAAHLDTMSFQARGFYEQKGYTVFGVLDDMPRGHKRYFMQKTFA